MIRCLRTLALKYYKRLRNKAKREAMVFIFEQQLNSTWDTTTKRSSNGMYTTENAQLSIEIGRGVAVSWATTIRATSGTFTSLRNTVQ
mmetsp:Transcript_9371/g.20837  ORF Transcript_9371/g.20837 Transcript_9371/m.20837 type:complete len:88 (+) Transcript_9371:261-524(+)